MTTASIFADNFSTNPWWWDGFAPPADPPAELPASAGTLIVGAGYAGIACALRLAEAGEDVLVLDAAALGFGASTRSGGQVSGGVNVGKSPTRRPLPEARKGALLRDAAAGFTLFEELLSRHQIRCGYHRTGRINGFWAPQHERGWHSRVEDLNRYANADVRILSRAEFRQEIGSDFYHGGVSIGRAGHVQPAEFFGGLLGAARHAGARCHGETPVRAVRRVAGGYVVETARGNVDADRVVFAANAYVGSHSRGLAADLRRGVVPVSTHMIATEELPGDLARSLLPTDRAISETCRVISHYRLSPDGRRLLFGSRATFFPAGERRTAELLYRGMLARFPQLAGTRITHSWGGKVAMTLDHLPHIGGGEGRYFVLGCNGSGVVMMTYLGHALAGKILAASAAPVNAYDDGLPPHHPLYDGTPWFMPAIGTWFQFRDRIERRAPSQAVN
jgi:glycine/D-amino acid oxidase-like deaminating enzyme